MEICIFEDGKSTDLEPLNYTRPVYDLVCGMTMIRKKILRLFPGVPYSLHTRPYLNDFFSERNPEIAVNKISSDSCLFINGRILPPVNFKELIQFDKKEDKLFVCQNQIVAAKVSGKNLDNIKANLNNELYLSLFDGIAQEAIEIPFINYSWDLTRYHADEMKKDYDAIFAPIQPERIRGTIADGVHLVNKKDIFIDEGAVIKAGVVIDACNGPVVIGQNSIVNANSVIEGPVYVGKSSQIKPLSVIYDNVSIGNVCKIGGEVEYSIIQSYSNKQHQGFLGHAYLGSWVNLGADTNCSDLKNNYSLIKAYANGKDIDTGLQFLGIIMGDHVKSGINTMFNTGTVVGFCSNIFGAEFPEKYIPSFAWGKSGIYDLQRSLDTAKKVMLRRNQVMSAHEEKLFQYIYWVTQSEREQRGYTS